MIDAKTIYQYIR